MSGRKVYIVQRKEWSIAPEKTLKSHTGLEPKKYAVDEFE